MNLGSIIVCVLLTLPFQSLYAQPNARQIELVLEKINDLRTEGCHCGSEYMPPVHALVWSDRLYEVAHTYVKHLYRNEYLSHIDKKGRTPAERLTAAGYEWHRVGENLAMGYDDFYAVLEAWLRSPSHCKMIMDHSITEMGMSKHHDYWVQSFAKPLEEHMATINYE